MSEIKTLEQGRASKAFEYANNIPEKLKKDKFKSHVKSFPMLIKTNGLGAAIAFLFSKGDKENEVYKKVGESVIFWLKFEDRYKLYGLENFKNLKELSEKIINLNSQNYRALTNEVLAYLNWLRRFSEGLSKE